MADWDVIGTVPAEAPPTAANPWAPVTDAPQAPPVSPGRVAGQVGTGAMDALYSAVMGLPDASAWVSRHLGLVPKDTPPPSEAFRSFASSQGNERPASWVPQNEPERIANAVGNAGGQVLGSLAPAGIVARAQSVGPVIQGAAKALTANPVQQLVASGAGAAAGEATGNPYVGAATTLAVPTLTGLAQRAVSAAPASNTQEAERRALLQFGQSIGAPLTAGKILDSKKLQTVESVLDKNPLPLVGARASATEAANRDAWQKAILEKSGITGETAATSNVTERATQKLGRTFENLTKGSTISVTPKFGQDLAGIKSEYGDRLFEDVQPGLMKRINELSTAPAALAQSGNPTVTLDGKTYQNIRSDLSRISGTATKAADRRAAGAMVDALDDMAEKSLPADVMGDWKTARQQWRNLLAIKGAVKGANNAETAVGNIPTAAFARRAAGNPDLEQLGQYGNAFVGDKIPNSGTASRHAAGLLAEGIPAAIATGHLPLNTATAGAAGAVALPYGFDFLMNNPATRALLLHRYAHPSQSLVNPGLYGALAGQQTLGQSR